jgi:tRNA threonylcarbamoyladenosine biosynthesis protein TsaE
MKCAAFALSDEAATLALGAALARTAPRGTSAAITVFLQGELGTGKTTLARALLRELGVAGTVRSPTYTLIEKYELADWQVLHLDLYRLRDATELEHLGLRDELRAAVMVLIEWPERAPLGLPSPDLRVVLSAAEAGDPAMGTDARRARINAETPAGLQWLNDLSALGHPRNDQNKQR